MEITNKKIPHNYRNKYLKNTSSGGFVSNSNTPSGASGLPYTFDEEGNYIVDRTITFKGNVLSIGEMCAYAENSPKYEGTYSPLVHTHTIAQVDSLQNILDSLSGGTSTTTIVVDNLTSTSIDSALSANQGRVLKELIDNKSSVSSWDELLNKPPTFPPSTHAHSWDELTSKPSTFPPSTHAHSWDELTSKPSTFPPSEHAHDDRYYIKNEIETKLASKSDNGHIHDDRYYTESEIETKLASKSNNGHGHSVGEISNAMPHSNFHWSGQGGQPAWLWGGNTPDDYYVYNPSNFSVNYANSASNADMVDNLHGSQFMRSDISTTCNGNILATGEITAYSDIRLKSNIKKLTNRGKLNPITYTKDGKESIGFIAQEVKEIYPELVIEEETKNKYLSLNYNQITAVLSTQINELTDKVNDLTTQIKQLKNNQ